MRCRAPTPRTDEEFKNVTRVDELAVEDLLAEFMQHLAKIGTPIWDVQAKALEKAPFMKAVCVSENDP